jgi:23S rRNA pseudouridine1911/1915/1917 synthase
VVAPPPNAAAGTIRTLYGRHPASRKRFTSRVETGKTAITHWRAVERFGDAAALLECRLETGRTHQNPRAHGRERPRGRRRPDVRANAPCTAAARRRARPPGAARAPAALPPPDHGARWSMAALPMPADMQALVEGLRRI